MQLQWVRVQHFRSIADTGKIRIDPRLTILAGLNGTGKSNVLQALVCFAANRFEETDIPLFEDSWPNYPAVTVCFRGASQELTITRDYHGKQRLGGSLQAVMEAEALLQAVPNFIYVDPVDSWLPQEGANGVFLLDEPSLYIKPKFHSALLMRLKQLADNHQVIITTHSPHMMDMQHLRLVYLDSTDHTQVRDDFEGLPYDAISSVMNEANSTVYRNRYVRYDHAEQVIHYLTQVRKIPELLVGEAMRRGLLYQNRGGDCVFLCFDSENTARSAIIRGTDKEVRFVDRLGDTSFPWVWKGQTDTAVVVEAPIDALSYIALYETSHQVIALGGCIASGLMNYLACHRSITKIIIATDQDAVGHRFAALQMKVLPKKGYCVERHCSTGLDWNDDWVKAVQEEGRGSIFRRG